MIGTKVKAVSVSITVAVLSACASGGGATSPTAGAGMPITVGAVMPAPGTPIATQCAANTFCGPDTVTISMPATMANGTPAVATGAPTVLGTTTLTATLDPVTGNPTGATMAGAINTNVALALQPGSTNTFAGIAANGQKVDLTVYGAIVPATATSLTAGLTYSNFGNWEMKTPGVGAGTLTLSAWAGGQQITTAMPTTGSATYAGLTKGWSQVANTTYELDGRLNLTANFNPSGGTVAGNITNFTALNVSAATPVAAGSFNNLAVAGTIAGNGFNGSVTAGAAPAGINPAAIAAGTVGTMAGHFYGPAANEVTGVWGISTATGSFGAKQ